jgi:hypothetical protein
MTTIKLSRGQKLCPGCNKINASRQRVCKHCDREFISKNTPIKNEILDWKKLERGDYIRIVQGTGPYFLCTRDTDECTTGERLCMGNKGVYKVVGLDRRGIRAVGASHKNGGFVYLYMGEPYCSKETGLYYEPYRLITLKEPYKKKKKKNEK